MIQRAAAETRKTNCAPEGLPSTVEGSPFTSSMRLGMSRRRRMKLNGTVRTCMGGQPG
jgi:hypothetical protein